ncbi:glycosyltransferase family 2 protein [Ramlibacter sp.]|uniref:glycosyltransferase family 2 protein n=1 Tax=Ramlibacter sp. TaxID=1917967 RepID=UPI003D0FDBD0
MSSPSSVDVCIVNWFGAADVERCVRALGPWPHGRTWIVDNSDDAAEARHLCEIARQNPGIEVIDTGANLGFARACNIGFERSDAELFLLLNPDAIIVSRDLTALVEALRGEPRFAALSPRIWWNEQRSFLLPTASPQTPRASIEQVLAARLRGRTMRASGRELARQQDLMHGGGVHEVDFLAGAVLLVRRDAALAAGGLFDPDYFMFYEDSDLSVRLRRAGWRLGVASGVDAVHEYRHKAFKAELMMQTRERYFRKRFPLFRRFMPAFDSLARPVPVDVWFDVLPQACASADHFRAMTADAAVLAFSPSATTMPAIFRPRGHAPMPFSHEEWELLEPAPYVALVALPDVPPRWVSFTVTR